MDVARKLETDAPLAVFEALDDNRVGMLGVVGSDKHMQPMTHFVDRENDALWFITSRETELVREIGPGVQAHHCVMAPGDGLYLCLAGAIEQSDDRGKLDQLWSAVTAAWFEEGREDSDVQLLKLQLRNAGVWTATSSGFVFGLEVARANLSREHTPDVGDHQVVQFGGA